MENEFANRLGMFRTVNTTLQQPQHSAVWNGNDPLAFGMIFEEFTTALADLEEFVVEHGKDITGSAADKKREGLELCDAAHQLGSALVTWFGRRSDLAHANEVRRSLSAWQDLADPDLAQQSKIVINSATAAVNGPDAESAANYGITSAAVAHVTKERSDFTALIASPQEKIAARKALTAQYRPRFSAVEALLAELDNLVPQFRVTAAGRTMVAAYRASRTIRDLGHGPSKPPEAPSPPASP